MRLKLKNLDLYDIIKEKNGSGIVSWNKFVRNINKANKVKKDVKMMTDFAMGDTKSASRRAKNKVKGKIVRKIFRMLG